MAQDGTATAIRPRHRRDPRGDSLRSGRHRQEALRRAVGAHGPHDLVRYAPHVPELAPAGPVETAPRVLREEPVDAAAILPWLVVLGFLGLLGMVLTSLS